MAQYLRRRDNTKLNAGVGAEITIISIILSDILCIGYSDGVSV